MPTDPKGTHEDAIASAGRPRTTMRAIAVAVAVAAVVAAISIRRLARERTLAQRAATVAERERARAERQHAAALLEEHGRQELLAGNAQRAAVLLAEAYRRHDAPGPALRVSLAAAVRGLHRRVRGFDGVIAHHAPTATVVRGGGADVSLWNLADGTRQVTLGASVPSGATIGFAGGGSIVVAGADRRLWLFDRKDGRVLATIDHGAEITAHAIDDGGDHVLALTGGADHTVKLWDGRTGRLIKTFTIPRGEYEEEGVSDVDLSPGGTLIAVGRGNSESGLVLDGRTGAVRATLEMSAVVEFVPGGERLIAGAVGSSFLYDVATGKDLGMIGPHFSSTLVSPDHRRILIAGQGPPEIVDAITGTSIATLQRPPPVDGIPIEILDMTWSPDSTRVALTSNLGSDAWICDAEDGTLVRSLGHDGGVTTVRFSADGARIVTVGSDRTAKLWEASSGRLLASIDLEVDPHAAWFLAGDAGLVVTSPGRVDLFTATPDGLVAALPGRAPAYAADGSLLIAVDGRVVRVADGRTGAPRHALAGHAGEVTSATFAPRGPRLVTASADGTARVWDAATGAELATLRHGVKVIAAAWSADGAWIATVGGPTVKLWDPASGALRRELVHPFDVEAVVIDPTARRAFVRHRGEQGWLWDLAADTPVARYPSGGGIFRDGVFSPDGSILATTTSERVALWDAATGKAVGTPFALDAADRAQDTYLARVGFDPGGARLLIRPSQGPLHVVDVRAARAVVTLGGDGRIEDATFSPDGRWVATADGDARTARVHDVATGRVVTLIPHRDAVDGVWFTPDGQLLITESDGALEVWDLAGRWVGRARSRREDRALAIHPDGTRIAVPETDWEAPDGTEHRIAVWDLAREVRPPAEVEADVAARSPWQLEDGRLVPRAAVAAPPIRTESR